MEEIVTEFLVNGKNVLPGNKPYRKTTYDIDHGKLGVTHVVVYDPCISEESQALRRQAMVDKMEDLIRRGLA